MFHDRLWRRGMLGGFPALLGLVLAGEPLAGAQVPTPRRGAEILRDIRGFGQLGGVLHVAAHPDDENTQLLTYLALGRNLRTAYLSITRGDGGQNVLGPEFGDELGVIRTQELLAGRRLDGAIQFFTRATDFGYSKTAEETLRIWDRREVLGDVVRIIRMFRPDVIITRFNPQTGGTHGHHTASAILAREAFLLAGDPNAYPEQLKELTVWQPTRLYLNAGGGGRGGGGGGGVQIDIGGTDPVSGRGFGEIANASRSMHRSQGLGGFGGRGRGAGPVMAAFTLLAGDGASGDILAGVDTTWRRMPGGGETIARHVDEVIAGFDPGNPAASLPALMEIKRLLAALPVPDRDPIIPQKVRQLDRIIADCAGLALLTSISRAQYTPGDTVDLVHVVWLDSSVPVRWLSPGEPVALPSREAVSKRQSLVLPADAPVTQPYWLREPPGEGLHKVDNPALIGTAQNDPPVMVDLAFEISGQKIVLREEPVVVSSASLQRMEVLSPVTVSPGSEVRLLAPGARRSLEMTLVANRPNVGGTLRFEVPPGWTVSPESRDFRLAAGGEQSTLAFEIQAPAAGGAGQLRAVTTVEGRSYSHMRREIRYEHIAPILLQSPAIIRLASFDMARRGARIGYIPGAGDSVAQCLAEMGYQVTALQASDLSVETLRDFDAVVIGVRAFNVYAAQINAAMPALTQYVSAGGTLVAQYNRPDGQQAGTRLGPYAVRIANLRTTDETAAPTFLAPDHPVLNRPNKITAADFEGWVQERGIYYPQTWDEAFTPILAFADPGEQPQHGSLLVARHGDGYFVYTSLVFFRELPAGVPGAYRLFANLVSLGRP